MNTINTVAIDNDEFSELPLDTQFAVLVETTRVEVQIRVKKHLLLAAKVPHPAELDGEDATEEQTEALAQLNDERWPIATSTYQICQLNEIFPSIAIGLFDDMHVDLAGAITPLSQSVRELKKETRELTVLEMRILQVFYLPEHERQAAYSAGDIQLQLKTISREDCQSVDSAEYALDLIKGQKIHKKDTLSHQENSLRRIQAIFAVIRVFTSVLEQSITDDALRGVRVLFGEEYGL